MRLDWVPFRSPVDRAAYGTYFTRGFLRLAWTNPPELTSPRRPNFAEVQQPRKHPHAGALLSTSLRQHRRRGHVASYVSTYGPTRCAAANPSAARSEAV